MDTHGVLKAKLREKRAGGVYKNVPSFVSMPCIALHSTAMARLRGRHKQLMMQ
jgi:hypothetical protein